MLTSLHMKKLWSKGCIRGFLTKEDAERKLTKQQNGCFLLRFSDSEQLGGVSIVYVEKTQNHSPIVQWIRPYTSKDLSKISMVDVVLKLDELKYLYPSTSKDIFRLCQEPTNQENTLPDPRYNKALTLIPKIEGNEQTNSRSAARNDKDCPSQVDQQSDTSTINPNVIEKSDSVDMDTEDFNLPKPVDSDEIMKELFSNITSDY